MKYLKLFVDFEELMEALDDGERGRLFSAMLTYAREGAEPRLAGNERFLWPAARQQIDKTREQYEKTVAANTQNARKGGRPKAQKAVDLTARAEGEPVRMEEPTRREEAPAEEVRAEEVQAEEVRVEEVRAGDAWAKLLERARKEKSREEVQAEEAPAEEARAKVLPAEGAEVRQEPPAAPAEEEIPLPGEEDAPPVEQAFLPGEETGTGEALLPGETAGTEEIPLPGEEDAPPMERAFLPREETGAGEPLLPGETAGSGEGFLPGEEDLGEAEKVPIPEELRPRPELGIAIALPMPDGKPYPLFDYKVRQWEEKYPQVAVRQELEKIRAWLLKNPQRRRGKNEIIPFILRWLEKNRRRAPASARRAKERPAPSFDLEEIRRLMLEDSGG